ncbi:type VI secretion protein [Primorskyibacter flagellatus]|uniref:Type VI secretion protein n=1 Tax=Primorskyibacter flagellatus TaxID=1387277 RepID=A0A917A1I3_9RHOB|nr:type VI secretion system membrane subunit TssM [Primorskyibacter flagellatus]GGE22406.1 type VI secretion protein [Primorskyibacter flagellatus]
MRWLSKLWSKPWARIPMTVLGVLCICAAIWFGLAMTGVELLQSGLLRGGLIALILVPIGVYYLIRYLRRRKAAQELEESLMETPVGDGAVLAERMQEALARLKKDGGATYLYDLPWYVIIGPPGAGKTTALVHSGLEFPGTDKAAVAGFGGTKNCDFWFAEDAVMIDTAGRYTTQDSDARADNMSWAAFLDHLKRARPNQPINGVILAFSCEDMMTASDDDLDSHALTVRKRLSELHEKLRIDVPVYVMFTKADMIAGFREYFGPFGEERRKNVWGVTFQTGDRKEETYRAVPAEFDALISRLSDEVTDRLNEEPDSVTRISIFGFPGQMALLQRNVSDFLRRVFQKPQETGAILRGFYFTSGTQEGTPIDQVLGTVDLAGDGGGLGLGFMSGKGRSYFLYDLLKKVIFEERDWVGYDLRTMRRRALMRSVASLTIAVACLAAMGLFGYAFWQNATLVRAAEQQSQLYHKEAEPLFAATEITDPDPSVTISALAVLREIPGGYGNPVEQPFYERVGLSRRKAVRTAATTAYHMGLERHLRPRMMLYLENELPQLVADRQLDRAYHALKVYMLLAREPNAKADDPSIVAYFAEAWLPYFSEPGQDNEYREMMAHLAAMLELDDKSTPLVKANGTLISSVQKEIAPLSLAERAYSSILSDAADMIPFSVVEELSGAKIDQVFRTTDGTPLESLIVPGLFTYGGYWSTFRDEMENARTRLEDEKWVLGEVGEKADYERQLTGLAGDLHALYRRDFVARWTGMLDRIELVPMSNGAPQFPSLAVASSAAASPILQLAEAVDRETRLSRFLDMIEGAEVSPEALASGDIGNQLADAGFDEVERRSGALKRIALNMIRDKAKFQGRAGAASASPLQRQQLEQIEAPLEKWHAFVKGDPVLRNRPVDVVLDGLKDILTNRQAAARSPTGLEEQGLQDALNSLVQNTPFYPEQINVFINQIEREFLTISANASMKELNRALAEEVTAYCRQNVENLAPFANGNRFIPTNAFGEFFGHNGRMDKFYQTYLRDHTQRAADGSIVGREDSPLGARLASGTLSQFARAERIRQAFFPPDASTPSVVFTIRQLQSSDLVEGSYLDLGDRKVQLLPNSSGSRVTWPDDLSQIILTALPQRPEASNTEGYNGGQWAILSFLERGRGRPQGSAVDITQNVGGRPVKFRLEFDSITVPFLMRELRDFRCPATLE